MTTDERLQQIEDRFAIQDLVAEYCRAIDDRDLDAFIGCFTVDGVLRHRDGVMRLDGRDALRAYYTNRFKQYGVTFHYPHAQVVTFDGAETAHGWVSAHAEMGLDGEGWTSAFRYTDRYRKVDGRWLFAERELAAWYYMKLADLPHGMGSPYRKHYKGTLVPAELPESLETYRTLHGLP